MRPEISGCNRAILTGECNSPIPEGAVSLPWRQELPAPSGVKTLMGLIAGYSDKCDYCELLMQICREAIPPG